MHAGLTREQALTPLTELAGGETAGIADERAAIADFAISPDGDQVAFTTQRTVPARLPGVRQPAGGGTGAGRTVRRRPAQRHAHARDPRLRRRRRANSPTTEAAPAQDPYERTTTTTARSRPPSPPTGARSRSPRPPSTSSTATATRRRLAPGGPRRQRRVRRATPGLRLAPDAADDLARARRPTARAGVAAGRDRASRARDGSVLLYVEVPAPGTLRATAASAIPILALGARAGAPRTEAAQASRASRAAVARDA